MKGTTGMKTEKLWINSTVRRNNEADDILREFAEKCGISGKDYQHLCLLTEETLGMANQLLKNFDGEIWIEQTPRGYEIFLEADVREDENGRTVPEVSPEGFMAKIAGMLNCSYMFENAAEMPEDLAGMLPDYMSYGIPAGEKAPAWAGRWSLSAYRFNLQKNREGRPGLVPVLEELEKSVVARLADEVTIGIHGHRIRLVITKNRQQL